LKKLIMNNVYTNAKVVNPLFYGFRILSLVVAVASMLPAVAFSQPSGTSFYNGVGPAPVSLGEAENYVILAKTAISTVPTSAITGDLGISPAAATYITGFSLISATGYATSSQLTGRAYAADMANPTPANLTTAVSNMEAAFTDAAGRPDPDFSELYVGNIGGRELSPGLYNWSGTVTAPTSFEISGGPNDVWIFQIAGDLSISSDVRVTLSGGARARNIFWQVSGGVSVGTNAHLEGVVLSMTAITLLEGASLNGRALAQTAVTLDKNTVTEPASGTTAGNEGPLPSELTLSGNYPNPFSPATHIGFALPAPSMVHLAVYDMLGREVAVLVSESRAAGHHQVTWNADAAPSGMYAYTLSANGRTLTGRMTLLK
jgi:hypothetical protein